MCQSKISIIVPVYNTGKYLPRCLESIMKQTYQRSEEHTSELQSQR